MFQDQFKGTEGEWVVHGILKQLVVSDKNVNTNIADCSRNANIPEEEAEANAKLFAASKKIAFELDNLLDALCGEQEAEDEIEKAFGKMIAHRIFMAKNALKQAL